MEDYGIAIARTLRELNQAVTATAGAPAALIIEPMSQKLASSTFMANRIDPQSQRS
jgi:hypothetical protein